MKQLYRCQRCRSQVYLFAVARVIVHWCYLCNRTTEHHRED